MEFLSLILKPPFIKGKVDKLTLIKIKNFYSMKGLMNKMKRQITDWEYKYGQNTLSGKGLVFRIHNCLKIDNKKPTNPIRKDG